MRMRMTLLAVVLLATGCDWFLGLKEGVAVTSNGGAGGGAGGEAGGAEGGGGWGGMGAGGEATGGSASAGANSGGMGPTCDETAFTVFAEADTVIIDGDCNGANYYGGTPYGNIGVGRGLFRFPLDVATATALQDGRMVELSVTLTRDIACLGAGNTCPAAPGVLSARPLRNDWTEGPQVYTPRGGADWCRRGAGSPGPSWQTPGAEGPNDSGGISGSSLTSATDPAVTIVLDPELHRSFDAGAAAPSLSVMVVPDHAAVFVVATKEELEALEPPARLDGVYCREQL